MHLSRRTDYSFRLLILLGLEPERTLCVADAAERLGLSGNHLAKIVQALAQVGVVETVRGRSGGVRLTAQGLHSTVGEVVRALEPVDMVECFDPSRNTCALTPACRLRTVLGAGLTAFMAELDRHTVQDLCARPTRLRRILA